MPSLPSLSADEIVRVLERKGFVFRRAKGSHCIYIHRETRRRVVVPMHKGDLPKGTLHEILKQAGISRKEFLDR